MTTLSPKATLQPQSQPTNLNNIVRYIQPRKHSYMIVGNGSGNKNDQSPTMIPVR